MATIETPEELEFDQNEKLTTRLADLVRNYPKGIGLVKEFLQNADDAGASELIVVYDRRQHAGKLPIPAMNVALGPSLLFINDKRFTQPDFENIQDIGGGGKLGDAARTGRFGQGFNTCYSVSDNPSLLTGSQLAWFDPHHRLEEISKKVKNAYAWKLASARRTWPDWVATFENSRYPDLTETCDGTVFRLPLRSPADAASSLISQDPFTQEDFEHIVEELHKVGPALIVFLRSVLRLQVYQIQASGEQSLRFSIDTLNAEEVESQRKSLREHVDGVAADLLREWLSNSEELPLAEFEHCFSICEGENKKLEETWSVTTGLFRGPDDELIEAALRVCTQREKALPWAGAAMCTGTQRKNAQKGGISCFLPVPEQATWPVWLHGWFDLSSNRRGITRDSEGGERQDARFEWNKSLMNLGVGVAWSMLVDRNKGDVSSARAPYQLWPKPPASIDEVDQELFDGFYEHASSLESLRVQGQQGHYWTSVEDEPLLVPRDALKDLAEPLLAEGWDYCHPSLPSHVHSGLDRIGGTIKKLTPGVLRDHLINTQHSRIGPIESHVNSMLKRKDWLILVAKYCAQDEPNNLSALPLALLANGFVANFGEHAPFYVATKETKALLRPAPLYELDGEFAKELGLQEPNERLGIEDFDIDALISLAQAVFEEESPTIRWVTAFFNFLTDCSPEEVNSRKAKLWNLKVVPDQQGVFQKLVEAPPLPSLGDGALLDTLDSLGIALIKRDSNPLYRAIDTFAESHDEFIDRLTPRVLANQIVTLAEDDGIHEDTCRDPERRKLILDYLSSDDWYLEGIDCVLELAEIPLFSTIDGEQVAASEADVYITSGFEPPEAMGVQYRILDKGAGGRWEPLLRASCVAELDAVTFVSEVFLRAFNGADDEQLRLLLTWLRDGFRKIIGALDDEQEIRRLRHTVRAAAIIPIGNGELGAARTTYFPGSEQPKKLLKKLARYPDPEFFYDKSDLWDEFFRDLSLRRYPLADHILMRLDEIAKSVSENGVEPVRRDLKKIVHHVADNWDKIATNHVQGNISFCEALRIREWLPAVSSEKPAYPAAAEWPDQLWRADKLVLKGLAHLCASEFPVLDVTEFPREMADTLGLIKQVSAETAVKHFLKVLNVEEDEEVEEDSSLKRSVLEFVRFVGRLNEEDQAEWEAHLEEVQTESFVLLDSSWREAEVCFLDRLPFPTSRLYSLSGEIGNERLLRKGFERLGIRPGPEFDDFAELLHTLATEYADKVLPEIELKEARLCLRQLTSAPHNVLEEMTLWLPTVHGNLVCTEDALVTDLPKAKLEALECSLPLVESNKDALEIARICRVPRLSMRIRTELVERPKLSTDEDVRQFGARIQERLRSRKFVESLRRLHYHEQGQSTEVEMDNLEVTGSLHVLRRIEIHIATRIEVQELIDMHGKDQVAFSAVEVWHYLDADEACLWLTNRSQGRMHEELVLAICELTGLNAYQMWVMHLINSDPAEMAAVLDERGISEFIEGEAFDLEHDYAEITDSTEVSEHVAQEHTEVTELYTYDDTVGEDELADESSEDIFEVESPISPSDAEASELDFDQNVAESSPEAAPWATKTTLHNESTHTPRRKQRESSNVPYSSSEQDKDSEATTRKSHEGKSSSTPNTPGDGSSTSSKKHSPVDRSNEKQSKLRSYVYHQNQDVQETYESNSVASEIGELGELIVMEYEKRMGRSATKMPPNNEGYDIVSERDGQSRYIEVKAINGVWGDRGVGVTRAQFETARQFDDAWWLYVVEHVASEQYRIVHEIQNPFSRATEYRFDAGWLAVSESVAHEADAKVRPEIGCRYRTATGYVVEVIGITSRGQLIEVEVKIAGLARKMSWSPEWEKL